jgi:FMNH2-dependent dimethyl sulfone monooxygenase
MNQSSLAPAKGFIHSAESRAANPLWGENRLKLGVFGINSVGCAQTLDPDAFVPSWERSLRAAEIADRAGFEAIVPYARWKSFVPDDPGHRSAQVMECFVWAAAIAARTSHATVFATCHVPVFHPVLAAKQAATIDQIAGGRFGLNVVAGWYEEELAMFGAVLPDHDRRYEQAAEWTETVRALWAQEGLVDREGDFYSVRRARLEPRPAQAPGPPIMNAGSSARGRAFAARHADLAFVMFGADNPEEVAAAVNGYRELAAAEGRQLQIWTPAYVVQEDSDAAALHEHERLREVGDYVAADAFIAGMARSASSLPPEVLRMMRDRIVQGGGGLPLVGTADSITERLTRLSQAGIDGILLSWVRYEEGLRRFSEAIIPRLQLAGLRREAR